MNLAADRKEKTTEERRKIRVLVVDDNPATRELMRDVLEQEGQYEVTEAGDGVEALKKLHKLPYQLVISDVRMPEMDGITLLTNIRAIHADIPVIIATAFGNEVGLKALELGADDLVYMPFRIEEFKFRVARSLRFHQLLTTRETLLAENRELWGKAITDRLTGLYNRQYFEDVIDGEFARAKRYRIHLGCLMFDIDHFKLVNDDYGHLIGDVVLREIGQLVLQTVRRVDIAARYGGEEFVVILPETTPDGVKLVADRLRQNIEEFQFCEKTPPEGGKMRQVTVSIGASYYPDPNYATATELLRAADESLYEAKNSGRNRVVVAWEQKP
ncbi:MAG TPA: diguanylate cyclase [Bacteroidetes bacterium]|nr:diguanylate cyclase [Bacteroidota bacterium]